MVTEEVTSTDSVVDIDWVLKYGDPRVKSYPWMDSPYKTYVSVIIFIIYIKIIAPKIMKNRPAYDLRSMMFIYNIFLVALSGWMFYRFAAYGWFNKYSWLCEPIDYSNDEAAVKILEAFYVYYISKFIEFLDTIFFVHRKKYNQVTFLHLFHHAVMPIVTWYYVKHAAGGYPTILPLTNCFAHITMYSYYLLSSLGPSVQKYIWWKRHITNIQMIQFMLMMLSSGLVMITRPQHCNVRYIIAVPSFSIGLVFFCLFTPFYINQYTRKKETKTA